MEITFETKMRDILAEFPEAKVGLFQQYHIGGCDACSYELDETLGDVKQKHNIKAGLDDIVSTIKTSGRVEQSLHLSAEDLKREIDSGAAVAVLDARQPAEYAKERLPGAKLIDVTLQFEILDEWPKETRIVVYSNHGERSLKRASHFKAYGMQNVVSLDGGLEAWKSVNGKIEAA